MPITELRIEGLRTIEKVRLTLDGLTVLIGDNGTGKSSILEACDILRRATGPRFLDEFHGIHGGLTALLRQGAKRLLLGVTITPEDGEYVKIERRQAPATPIHYDLILTPKGNFASLEETIYDTPTPHVTAASETVLPRKSTRRTEAKPSRRLKAIMHHRDGKFLTPDYADTGENVTFISTLTRHAGYADEPESVGVCIAGYLSNIITHIPFETTPVWAARALDRKSALRSAALLTPATHLEKLGLNLASSYHALKNNFGRAHWDATIEYIRLGLGERIEDVVTWADPGGGNIGLSLKLLGLDRPIPSSQLSDGMLSYLAFVALFRLHTTKPSLVAFDEPDLHLHPHLLMRVLDMFDAMARECPVLLATHSDRLLDGLTDPAKSVVLCELDEHGATRLVRPDRETLAKWLERYRGLGDIRSAGHAASVLTKVEPT